MPGGDKSLIRKAFEYDLSIDFDQQETRMIAALSQDITLLNYLKKRY
jgi:hypothetical protein